MARTPYKWFNINRIGPGKRVNGKSGTAETTIFWPYYSGKCRTVDTYSPRRNHGSATASRQTEKTVDTRQWRVDWLRIHSAKEMSQDRAQWRRKISEWRTWHCTLLALGSVSHVPAREKELRHSSVAVNVLNCVLQKQKLLSRVCTYVTNEYSSRFGSWKVIITSLSLSHVHQYAYRSDRLTDFYAPVFDGT